VKRGCGATKRAPGFVNRQNDISAGRKAPAASFQRHRAHYLPVMPDRDPANKKEREMAKLVTFSAMISMVIVSLLPVMYAAGALA